MKTFHYVLCCLTGISSIVLFFYGTSGQHVEDFTPHILAGLAFTIIFFLFALLEEKKEEIKQLKLCGRNPHCKQEAGLPVESKTKGGNRCN